MPYLTHLVRMEFPTGINWNMQFLQLEMFGEICHFFHILIELSVSKQWRP